MPARTKLPQDTREGAEAAPDPFENVADPRPSGLRPAADEVSRWAALAAARFTPEEAHTFLHHYRDDATLSQIAKARGQRGASGIHYWKESATRKLKAFLCDLPCLGPEDCDERLFNIFFEALLDHLENGPPAPYRDPGSAKAPSGRKRP